MTRRWSEENFLRALAGFTKIVGWALLTLTGKTVAKFAST